MVESIVDAMMAYRDHMDKIIDDTKTIHELSSSMLEISNEEIVEETVVADEDIKED